MPNIFIIIPAYNEEKSIVSVLCDIQAADASYHIIAVDDCSTDSTAVYAKQAGATVLQHIVNRGQGAALKTGTEYAIREGADIVVHFDADGQFVASEIAAIIAPLLKDEADIVFGSRFLSALDGKKSGVPFLKRVVLLPLARLFHLFFGVRLSDPQAGFRAFRADVFEKISWQQDRMAHCSEIIFNAFQNKLRIQEVPITVIYREFGQRFSGGLKIIKDIFVHSFIK
jgi:glycosyltransferase involved in cell wall biosynthesis